MDTTRWKDNDRFTREHGMPPDRPKISNEDLKDKYITIRKLVEGVGALNEGISLVRDKKTGRKYVQKHIDPNSKILLRELLLLQVLDHPNIVRYVDAFIDKSVWFYHTASLYLQYCNLKTAQDVLNKYHKYNLGKSDKHRRYVPEKFIWHIFRSLASALQYLHFGIQPDDKRSPDEIDTLIKDRHQYFREVWPMILHRDIKPDNIFFRKIYPEKVWKTEYRKIYGIIPRHKKTWSFEARLPRVILADFGIALQYNEPDWNVDREFIGTYKWMPPELPLHTAQGDVWAVGAVILALCRQMPDGVVKPPPDDWTQGEEAWTKDRVARKGIRDHGVGKYYSPELDDVVYSCLRFNWKNRPLAFRLLAMINEGAEKAEKNGFFAKDEFFPRWLWGGQEDRLHGYGRGDVPKVREEPEAKE
ncbi:MAG: hypothetical protein Q9224_002432 [Gallowayella concinna]